jgi:hypothetical protein
MQIRRGRSVSLREIEKKEKDDDGRKGRGGKDEPLLHVLEVLGKSEDGHALGSDRDVEAGLSRETLLGGSLTDGNLSEVSVVDVEDSVPVVREVEC